MSIVQTDIPITSQSCQRMIRQLVNTYPFCSTQVLTHTAYGRPVETLALGSGPRKVLYTAAHHANEWITSLALLKFAEDLAAAASRGQAIGGIPAAELLEKATVAMVPMVDPDGVDLVTGGILPGTPAWDSTLAMARNYPQIPFPEGWKANLSGVDLNLQYPAGWLQAREIKFSQGYTRPGPRDFVGRAPLTQPEARALAEYTQVLDPALMLAYHSQGQVIYWQFQDYYVPGARELAERFSALSGYALEEVPDESAYAGFKDWFIQNFRRPGFTVEVGRGISPLPLSQFPKIYADNLGILVLAATGEIS